MLFAGAATLAILFVAANGPPAVRKLIVGSGFEPAPSPGWVQSEFYRSCDEGYDLLFLGSSHIQRSFDPRFFDAGGLRSFSFGTSAQTPLNTLFLLKGLGDKVRTERVVLEVFPNLFKVSGAESFIDLYGSTPEMKSNCLSHAWATRDKRSFIGLALAKLRLTELERQAPSPVDSQITRGYVAFKQPRSKDFSRFSPGSLQSDRQLGYLAKVLERLQQSGVKTAVIITPLAKELLERLPDYESDVGAIQRVCDRFGLQIVDFNRIVQFDDSLFWDSNHLNNRGVEEFLPIFYAEFQRRGFLP